MYVDNMISCCTSYKQLRCLHSAAVILTTPPGSTDEEHMAVVANELSLTGSSYTPLSLTSSCYPPISLTGSSYPPLCDMHMQRMCSERVNPMYGGEGVKDGVTWSGCEGSRVCEGECCEDGTCERDCNQVGGGGVHYLQQLDVDQGIGSCKSILTVDGGGGGGGTASDPCYALKEEEEEGEEEAEGGYPQGLRTPEQRAVVV